MFKHILLPTDGSALSERARSARRRNGAGARGTGHGLLRRAGTDAAGVRRLHAGGLHAAGPARGADRKAQPRTTWASIEKAARDAGVPFNCLSVTSEFPADAIVEAAASSSCDLIFMASHGRRGLAAMLLGSETHKVLTHSKCRCSCSGELHWPGACDAVAAGIRWSGRASQTGSLAGRPSDCAWPGGGPSGPRVRPAGSSRRARPGAGKHAGRFQVRTRDRRDHAGDRSCVDARRRSRARRTSRG